MKPSKKLVVEAVDEVLSAKGSRKFTQSVDLAIGFKEIDFKKNEQRINLSVLLPHAPKDVKVLVYADDPVASKVKGVADLVLGSAQVQEYARDEKKQKELLNFNSLAEPQLMAVVGKALGKVLGAKGKLPAVLPPNADAKGFIDRARRTISLKVKGKMLPAVHCGVGNELMPAEQVADNVVAVLDQLYAKVKEHQVKSIVIKLTMGKPVKVSA
ncbi:50S ribosomal protein L1 [Candidatus Micrarchaeota archaeon CG_4_10_14_0_2_um_filter_55_9]|nr:MAG: hypothetical protein AUJ15_01265 [Candidatus Micrarchaeota archaeon CG1_02_55_41]PIO02523.1 MAG: 50S ribosomal protein L1 [Candidatus Micrarchaeota archaeon CG09_land_8_20_14_0_10_55_25]PIZ92117.1 MAG: 50S ribosomal protein L1 [Candidatus Micrarchaeota archaeon CG_4_10_14_0_2_um_filter_55_9]PJD01089.1 MAG: 50S ribosomal protein L1 [Candidatus Micrarchaeota archaeon CG10_big_fil_rev_8_21_14_0_10_54_18]